jgi:hypothetical protein
MKQAKNLIPSLILIAGIALGTTSCVTTSHPTKRTTVVVKEKKSHPAHPHGGPPGQTKKAPGHPGKKHK